MHLVKLASASAVQVLNQTRLVKSHLFPVKVAASSNTRLIPLLLLRHFYTTFYLVRGNTPVDEKSRVISTASLPTEHGLPTGRFAAGMLLVRFNTKLPFSGIVLESSLLP